MEPLDVRVFIITTRHFVSKPHLVIETPKYLIIATVTFFVFIASRAKEEALNLEGVCKSFQLRSCISNEKIQVNPKFWSESEISI